jgi:hypothetical protein
MKIRTLTAITTTMNWMPQIMLGSTRHSQIAQILMHSLQRIIPTLLRDNFSSTLMRRWILNLSIPLESWLETRILDLDLKVKRKVREAKMAPKTIVKSFLLSYLTRGIKNNKSRVRTFPLLQIQFSPTTHIQITAMVLNQVFVSLSTSPFNINSSSNRFQK